jgi:hypothetical protein
VFQPRKTSVGIINQDGEHENQKHYVGNENKYKDNVHVCSNKNIWK